MKKLLLSLFVFSLIFNLSFAISETAVQKKVDWLKQVVSSLISNPDNREKYYEPFRDLFLWCSKTCKNPESKLASLDLYENYDKYFSTTSENITTKKKYLLKTVVDWDTIWVMIDWKYQSVRLIGVDSPEKSTTRFWYPECYWEEAWSYLESLLSWGYVELEFDETQWKYDKYDRLLAYVFVNWENINEKMIGEWYWWEYTYNKAYKYQKEFKQAETKAKNNKKWLWNKCNWERRAVKEESKKEKTEQNEWCSIKWNIWNKNQKIYHVPWCSHYDKTVISTNKWEKWFCSETEAINAWWRKCID